MEKFLEVGQEEINIALKEINVGDSNLLIDALKLILRFIKKQSLCPNPSENLPGAVFYLLNQNDFEIYFELLRRVSFVPVLRLMIEKTNFVSLEKESIIKLLELVIGLTAGKEELSPFMKVGELYKLFYDAFLCDFDFDQSPEMSEFMGEKCDKIFVFYTEIAYNNFRLIHRFLFECPDSAEWYLFILQMVVRRSSYHIREATPMVNDFYCLLQSLTSFYSSLKRITKKESGS